MKYEQQILEAYARLGFKPRDRQVEYIDQIMVAFLDEKNTTVVLSAPTGTGKSIIGAVVAEAIHTIRHPNEYVGASFMLTATNLLAQQYIETFDDKEHPERFHVIKGARNYECNALSAPGEPADAESCAIQLFRKQGQTDIIDTLCAGCEYQKSRLMKTKARHLITNYSYFFIDRLYAQHPMPLRTVCIFDEAHLINDLFVEHNAVFVSEKRLQVCAEEVTEHLKLGNTDIFKNIKLIKDHLTAGKIDGTSYTKYARALLQIYEDISGAAKAEAERSVRNPSRYLKLNRLSKKYYNLGCKIDDLLRFQYPHVFEHRPKDIKKGQNEHEMHIKPIFVGEMFQALHNAEFNLLMSATISEQLTKRTMELPGPVKHIRLDPHFPPENKKVVFFKPMQLNYSSLKDPANVKRLCASIWQIVNHHTQMGERGVILAPSFVVAQSAAQTLREMGGAYRVFEQERGQPLAEMLDNFRAHKKGPAVLITPSGFEGMDLPGDLARYVVLVKAPFGSLGDKRVQHICNTYPDIYALDALMTLIQGAGRAVRSVDDWATTYVLDTAAQRLMTSAANEWKNEFQFSFKTILE